MDMDISEDLETWIKGFPLHCIAGMEGWDNMIPGYIEMGAGVNDVDLEGLTPLHVAVYWEVPSNVKELLINGADVNQQSGSKKSPLQMTEFHYSKEGLECIKILLSYGADINYHTREHGTILQMCLQDHLNDENVAMIELTKENVKLYIQHLAIQFILNTSNENTNTENFFKFCLFNITCNIQSVRDLFSKYLEEVIQMTKLCLGHNITLFQVLLNRSYLSMRQQQEPLLSLKHFFQYLQANDFLCFKTFILDRLTKRELMNSVDDFSLNVCIDGKVINLNGNILFKISKYLSKDDLYNFIPLCR